MKALVFAALMLLAEAGIAQGAVQDAAVPSEQPPASSQLPADSVAGSLLGYTSAVQLHLEQDPVLAATYLAFWNALAREPEPASLNEEAASRLLTGSELVSRALRQRYPQPPASYRLADALAVAVRAQAAGGEGSGPEALLAAIDRLVAPRVQVNGRYEFAGTLQGEADLGVGADTWLLCRESPACAEAHDKLFGKALGGVPLTASLAERLERDAQLRELPQLAQLTAGILGLDERLRSSPLQPAAAAAAAAGSYWRAIGDALQPASASNAPTDPAELQVLLDLGRASAWLSGSERLANTFEVVGSPLLDYSRLSLSGGGGFLAATAGVGLLFAGVQALSLFDNNTGPPPRELNNLIEDLHETTYRNFVGLRAESVLASNAIDTRLVRLGLTLDVVRDDVERIETGQRARVRADFLVQDARRWTEFDEDNDRCFSLRSMDPKTGRLRPADFRRCEDRFLQGAVRRAQYLNQAQDYLLDARYIEPDDLRFPFHHHYPLLLTQAGMNSKNALALVDPYPWQQHAAALLRLYQENPADAREYARRADALRSLRAPGVQISDALDGLVLTRDAGASAFNGALHRQALDAYFNSLRGLISRVAVLDDPEADRYGKRLTRGLDQPLPGGRKLAAIEAVLSGAKKGETALRACGDAPDDQFLAPGSGLAVAAPGFFSEPITAEELARSWNREAIAKFGFAPESWAELVPRPYLWAALDGHGELEICLATMRPAAVEFSRDDATLPKHLRGRARLEAELQVRFTPGAGLLQTLGLPATRAPVVVARYQATRACDFAYRNDDEGCSRGQCLADLAPQFWSSKGETTFNGGSCGDNPLPLQLRMQNQLEGSAELEPLAAAVGDLYWSSRAERSARLLADATRSREYENASVLYLQYFALAGSTLGIWPDPSAPLAPLFADQDALTPRAVLQRLIDKRMDPAALEVEIDAVRAKVLKKVNTRGAEVARDDARYRLPQLHALRETLSRIDMLLAGYQAS